MSLALIGDLKERLLWGLEYSRLRSVWFDASGGLEGSRDPDSLTDEEAEERYASGPKWRAFREHDQMRPKRYNQWHRYYWTDLQLWGHIFLIFVGFALIFTVSHWFILMALAGYTIPFKEFS